MAESFLELFGLKLCIKKKKKKKKKVGFGAPGVLKDVVRAPHKMKRV